MTKEPVTLKSIILNPIPRMVLFGVSFLIGLLDGAMRHCGADINFFACQSFIGKTFSWICGSVIISFVLTNILFPLVKWVVNSVKV